MGQVSNSAARAVAQRKKLADDPRIPLVSATGSVAMGLNVAKTVHGRLGRCRFLPRSPVGPVGHAGKSAAVRIFSNLREQVPVMRPYPVSTTLGY